MERFEVVLDFGEGLINVRDKQERKNYFLHRSHEDEKMVTGIQRIEEPRDDIPEMAMNERARARDIPMALLDYLDDNGYKTSEVRNRRQNRRR